MRHVRFDQLQLSAGRGPIFPGLEFATPWSVFDGVELAPGEGEEISGDWPCEQGYVALAGPLELRAGEMVGRSESSPCVFLAPVGCSHALINRSARTVRILHVRVEMDRWPIAEQQVRVACLEVGALQWRDSIHGGRGRIATRHLWEPAEFASSWTFVDHALLGPDSSVGYHYHDALEECFVVLAGQGAVTLAGQTLAVGPGSITFQGIRQAHGIYNPGPGELEFLRLAVARSGEKYTTVELGDDLAGSA